jgi:hypothetical protein
VGKWGVRLTTHNPLATFAAFDKIFKTWQYLNTLKGGSMNPYDQGFAGIRRHDEWRETRKLILGLAIAGLVVALYVWGPTASQWLAWLKYLNQ